MTAAVVHQFSRPLAIKERSITTPALREVVVRLGASGLSHTGIHTAHCDGPVTPTLPVVTSDEPRGNLLLLGPPASGKGTQAHLLSERLNIPPIATGNILRAELARRTELGLRAHAYMQRGDLVPDALMINIVGGRLRRRDRRAGFLLDGFPRTVPQARALDALAASMAIGFDRVLYLNVPEPELIRRITSRLTCSVCGRSYFVEAGQRRPGSCAADGMALIVREDDRPTTARRRIAVYLKNTLPVLEHYREQGLVTEIDGIGSVEEVSRRMLRALPAARSLLGCSGRTRG